MEANDPMTDRFYVRDPKTLLFAKHFSCGFRVKDFLKKKIAVQVYGSYMLTWQPQFNSNQLNYLMQPLPLPIEQHIKFNWPQSYFFENVNGWPAKKRAG